MTGPAPGDVWSVGLRPSAKNTRLKIAVARMIMKPSLGILYFSVFFRGVCPVLLRLPRADDDPRGSRRFSDKRRKERNCRTADTRDGRRSAPRSPDRD